MIVSEFVEEDANASVAKVLLLSRQSIKVGSNI